jgi:hypothetical protein
VTVDAGSHRRRFAFFLDVVVAISDEGPSMAIGHHVGPKVAAIDTADRNGSTIPIKGPGFAGDVAFANCARKCSVAARPAAHPSAHGWLRSNEKRQLPAARSPHCHNSPLRCGLSSLKRPSTRFALV